MPDKPANLDEYKEWLEKHHDVKFTDRIQTRYDSVTLKIKEDYERSTLWKEIAGNLSTYDQEYLKDKGYPLFIPNFRPELSIKPFESFFLKTFRKNILDNKRYPEEPEGGWILPDNWFLKINDILRTLFVVKYLDGVEFMIKKVESVCEKQRKGCKVFLEAREEGYYAAHLYTKQECEIPRETWDTEIINVPLEIQVTTQLQEVIRILLHKYYRKRREKTDESHMKWQWDYTSDEFVANYLGHILHYVEGMIMEIREERKSD